MPGWKRPFFIVGTGQAFSLAGSELVRFALIGWLTEETGSATTPATATLVSLLPFTFLGPFIGALINRRIDDSVARLCYTVVCYRRNGEGCMGEVTIGGLVRLFLKIEAVGIAIVVLGALMDLNPFIISLGLIVMIPGFGLISLAGTLKALERSVLAAERQKQRMGEPAGVEEEEEV